MLIDFHILSSYFAYPPTHPDDSDEEEEEEQGEDLSEENKSARSPDYKQRVGYYSSMHNHRSGKIHDL